MAVAVERERDARVAEILGDRLHVETGCNAVRDEAMAATVHANRLHTRFTPRPPCPSGNRGRNKWAILTSPEDKPRAATRAEAMFQQVTPKHVWDRYRSHTRH